MGDRIKGLGKLDTGWGIGFKCNITKEYIISVKDKNGEIVCAPCQTIKYTCADNPQIVEQRRICPTTKDYEKTEEEIDQEVDQAVKDLFNRNCHILTPGHFYSELNHL